MKEMKKMILIKEFICGEAGKPAFIVDAQDRVLRTSMVVRIEKQDADILVETRNSLYCTARYYDFGYFSKSLIASDEDGSVARNEMEFAIYDITYKSDGIGRDVQARMLHGRRTPKEDSDAKSVVSQFCWEFPNFFFLRQFCRVSGRYRLAEDGSDHEFLYSTKDAVYIITVGLLKPCGYHVRVHCYRQESRCCKNMTEING